MLGNLLSTKNTLYSMYQGLVCVYPVQVGQGVCSLPAQCLILKSCWLIFPAPADCRAAM